jgi:hypothetical protein
MARGAIRRGNLTLYPNYQLGAELRRTAIYDAELRRLASEGALGAKELAVKDFYGVDSRTGAIGAYYQSIHGELGRNRRGLRVGLVVADDWKAHWAEGGWTTRSGTKVKGRKILARGGRRAGLRVRAPRKRG